MRQMSSVKHDAMNRLSTQSLLLLLWVFIQSYLYSANYVLTELEATKYIREATNLLQGTGLSSWGYLFYLTEISIIGLFKFFGINIQWVVAVHLLINLSATYYLRKAILDCTNHQTANIGTAAFIIFLPIQQFNFQLQTESIFLSLIIFHTYYSIQTIRGEKNSILKLFIIQAFLIFTRPPGILWLLPTSYVAYKYLQRVTNNKSLKWIGLLLVLTTILATDYILQNSNQLNLLLPFQNQSIICGVPSQLGSGITESSADPNSILGLLLYLKDNFGNFLKLSAQKASSFFFLYRPYYSKIHNLFLICWITPIYFLALAATWSYRKNYRAAINLCIIAIGVTFLMVVFSCDDWHNRFALSVFSYFIILSSIGLHDMKIKMTPKEN